MKKPLTNIVLELVTATEDAAIASYRLFGCGNEMEADKQATEAMRRALNKIDINGVIVIGEGERDEAPMLFIGEKVGTLKDGVDVDIAVDPLEGTTILANGNNNSLSVLAVSHKGDMLAAPDVYMDKIAVGFEADQQIIDIDLSPSENLENISNYLECEISDLLVVILDRPRHKNLIEEVRKTGARVKLISDGDVAAVISTALVDDFLTVYMGIGGAPEGVIAAAALKTYGGQMSTKLIFKNDDERNRAKEMGIIDLNKKYTLNEIVRGNAIFIATGVTDGSLLTGVKISENLITTNSLVADSFTKTIRYLETTHKIN